MNKSLTNDIKIGIGNYSLIKKEEINRPVSYHSMLTLQFFYATILLIIKGDKTNDNKRFINSNNFIPSSLQITLHFGNPKCSGFGAALMDLKLRPVGDDRSFFMTIYL